MTQLVCFKCEKQVPILGTIGRRDECPFCKEDLHCCRNCEHYDPKSYNECREPAADRVVEKDRSNYCDHFTPRKGGAGDNKNSKDALKAAAEALFKK